MRIVNNDQNIDPVHPKMSEDFHNGNNSKLLNCVKGVSYFNEINDVETETSDEEVVVDHMYATNTENDEKNNINEENPPFSCQTAESEVRFIKEWLILHTDLIQQQNDDIIDKDREIHILRKENEMLKERINCLEKGIPYQPDKSSDQRVSTEEILEDMTQGPCQEESKENIQLFEEQYYSDDGCSLEINYQDDHADLSVSESQINNSVVETPKDHSLDLENSVNELKDEDHSLNEVEDNCYKPESDILNCSDSFSNYNFTINNICDFDPMKNLRMSIRRKRVTSNSSALSQNESVNLEEKEAPRRLKKKKRRPTKNAKFLTSSEPFVTQSHEVSLGISPGERDVPECLAASLEVPRWRHKIYGSFYTLEGTENLDDEVFNKRHMRPEYEERRRKRWDFQRIREQRVIEKLKQRQDRVGLGSKPEENEPVHSLWPKAEDVKFLEIVDELPVSAFGQPIPRINKSEFELPWMKDPSLLSKKPHSRKSTSRRRRSKR
ncbi:uncharacterized protein [Leptinotarsa decemlineata]|uniref:uncharacterized protein n=1 Tax=Leptinotarsa decemlineata TaxID=7539 RepID=UPI003D30427D